MPAKNDLAVQFALAQAMADELENYVLGDDLYRQLVVRTPAGDRMPRMSLGLFLDTLKELEWEARAGHLTAQQEQALAEMNQVLEDVRHRFPTAYREKLTWELKSNLDSWNWFLQECQDNLRRCREEYPFEVRIRNRIATLVDALDEEVPPEHAARLKRLDARLRELFVPGRFVLAKELEARYPRERYWWLYGEPARRP